MKNITATILLAGILSLTILSSCKRNEPGAVGCPGTVVATWKADGITYQSSTSVFTTTSTKLQINFAACSSDGTDRLIQFGFTPYPLTTGTYPLKYNMLGFGQPYNGYAGAFYALGNDNYTVDSTGTGSITITDVNTANSTFTASFSFAATKTTGNPTIQISDGIINNAKF